MSDMYAIKTSTLTALGDAVRNKSGKLTKIITVIEKAPVMKVSKTPNATGFTTYEGDAPTTTSFDVVNLPQATKIKVKLGYYNYGLSNFLQIGEGSASNSTNFNKLTNIKKYSCDLPAKFQYKEEIFNSNTITFYYMGINNGNNIDLGYYAECIALDVDGNEIASEIDVEVEKEVLNTMTPLKMVEEINNIPTDVPTAEELTITDNCAYRFSNGGWDWFIEKYGDKITTKNITGSDYMFYNFSGSEIPFDINFDTAKSYHNCDYLFSGCMNINSIPKINGMIANDASNMFNGCQRLRELDYESVKDIDWSYMEKQTSSYSSGREYTFNSCYSLRSFPMEFLNHGNPVQNYSGSVFYSLFGSCYALDEVIDLPNPHSRATWTGNAFYNTFYKCGRLKNITFALQDDGTPYVCPKWKSQTIDLYNVGYVQENRPDKHNSGITEDTCIKDDASYQALKDHPDAWTTNHAYSRYNHDSAVATINSLPDVSASGGTNTIRFLGIAGALTDGGAINTLTEEEIAVAAAKGWTISLS